MNEKRLFRIIGDVDDDLVEEAAAPARSRPALGVVALRWGAMAACLVLVVGFALTRFRATPQLLPADPATVPGAIRAEFTPFSSPAGVRKFFNYGGYRYAFLEDGAPYDLSALSLTDRLGILEEDILGGMEGDGDNQAASRNLATTYALGGELYRIPGYDPAYRMAVAWEGETYLAELVGRVDNQPLEAGYLLEVGEIEARVRRVEIQPHMGGEALATVKGGDAKTLVRLLADSTPAQLAEADYLAMAAAQSDGRSWQLVLRLNDGTSLHFYLIPTLGLVSLGDSTYTLPEDFQERWGSHFDGLSQGAPPLY